MLKQWAKFKKILPLFRYSRMCMYQIFVALFADSAMTKYKNNETATYLYLKLKDLVSGVIRRNAYSEVNLDKLFQSTFQIKTKNHQLTGWYWVDNCMSYKPYEKLIYQMKCFHEPSKFCCRILILDLTCMYTVMV